MRSKRYVFTIFNPTIAHLQALESIVCKYIVYGRETCPTTGTPHLQGFLILVNARSLLTLREEIGGGHWEPARGTSEQAREYCIKDGDYVERGVFPGGQGERTDVRESIAWVDGFIRDTGRAPTDREIAVEQPLAFLRYPRLGQLAQHRAPGPNLRTGDTLDWQALLDLELDAPADDRSVVFYVDQAGGKGKTWFTQWYLTKNEHTVQVVGVAKRDDMAHAIDPSKRVFFLNVPRGQMEYLQYSVLEMLKDRMVFSPKYQSRMKYLSEVPHVIVFCNEFPDMARMSIDRYVIREL